MSDQLLCENKPAENMEYSVPFNGKDRALENPTERQRELKYLDSDKPMVKSWNENMNEQWLR